MEEATNRLLRIFTFTGSMMLCNCIFGAIYKVSPLYIVANVFLSTGLFLLLGLTKTKKEDA